MKKRFFIAIIVVMTLSFGVFAYAGTPVNSGTTAEAKKIFYLGEELKPVVPAQKVDGIMMVPIRSVAEAMDYKVTWNKIDSTIEISKGAQWTKVKVGDNAYFKNRMSEAPLSKAPVIVNGKTLIPLEFFSVILDRGIQIEKGNLLFSDEQMAIQSGYIQDIVKGEEGVTSITISSVKGSDDPINYIIINTSAATTFFQKEVVKGAYMNAICTPIMTMSIPAQTSAYVIY